MGRKRSRKDAAPDPVKPNGVWVEGILHVVPTVSPYGAVGFQMEGLTVSVLE
jgi:hypothetical protein